MATCTTDSYDIEDVLPGLEDASTTAVVGSVVPRVHSKRRQAKQEIPVGYDIPGVQTVYVKTYGCSHNVSDGEYMAGLLADYGYKITSDFENADCYLINSCTVKNPSQDTFVNLVHRAKSLSKPVVVSGCVPQGDPKNSEWDGLSVIGTQQIGRVVEVVEEALRGNAVQLLGRSKRDKPSLDMPKIRKNRFIEIIPINLGCLNACTYCKTKHARGNLNSYRIDEILARAKSVLDEGVRELRITSEDTGAYGRDIDTNIVELLKRLAKLVEQYEGAMLRVGMTNPPYIMEHLDGMAEVLNMPSVYSFLHIPVQAGSDRVLDLMKREYTVSQFQEVVDVLRARVPNITIATDIICGFPGETDEEFQATLALCEQYKFSVLNISQFYPRPGTPAALMKRTATRVVKDRSRMLTRLFDSYSTLQNLVGTQQRVWITEIATDGHNFAGHTKGYVQVLVDPQYCSMGAVVECEIVSASKFSVVGRVLQASAAVQPPPRHSTRVQSGEAVSTETAPATPAPAACESTQQSTSSAPQLASSSFGVYNIGLFVSVCMVIWFALLAIAYVLRSFR
eukprot:TRINITY_DN1979_c0_g1_i3.p1 TRINITY_DN1979_c0_g1~~TRINITY_DN1979_c0_g1_i3.p1  ORF type:complete len:587 (+),score=84.39 TRINITY_DN1979_c0_g1_i3:68-1762(+)